MRVMWGPGGPFTFCICCLLFNYGGLDGMFHGDGMPWDHGMQWSMAVST